MNRISAVVILYYPNYEKVYKNISSYISDIDTLYIIGNSKLDEQFLKTISTLSKVKVIHNSTNNLGIAEALNKALYQAKEDKYTHLLTMDQDSFFEKSDFKRFLKDFNDFNNPKNIIYSPIHNKKFLSSNIIETNFTMTSGNIINIDLAIKINGFEEKLFIDDVDHEFCFRSHVNNFKIIENKKIALNHNLGEKIGEYTIYNPNRLYYMSRNFLFIWSKYKKIQKDFFRKRSFYLIKFFFLHLVYSNKRIESLKMILLGIIDYNNKKFGKSSHE